jgi:hypothetical protein
MSVPSSRVVFDRLPNCQLTAPNFLEEGRRRHELVCEILGCHADTEEGSSLLGHDAVSVFASRHGSVKWIAAFGVTEPRRSAVHGCDS